MAGGPARRCRVGGASEGEGGRRTSGQEALEASGETGSRELGVLTEEGTEEAANPQVGLELGVSASLPLTGFCKFSAVLRVLLSRVSMGATKPQGLEHFHPVIVRLTRSWGGLAQGT